ncbi:ATP-dependent helicase [Paenibacillus sp. J2TS4]|uniref:ATP-dependent helicase n=1 Tax=Paenibacillus sp. J2TS4 TaxID=2807194 RepID=UPI001B0552F2|nr:ATP-dependent helicase [Paenibacillus sp. J2TS4]GIP34895.1 DNA helicase [Paenibacillus sp. J2TS4]
MNGRENLWVREKRELGISLNEVQEKVVFQTEGPLLLLASPGSGKTTTIVMRIGHLVEQKGVNPSRIKAVTFSRAAANDMKERYKSFFPEHPPVDFSTIHSFAFEVVRDYFRRAGTPYLIIEGGLDSEEGALGPDQLPLHKKVILRKLFHSMTNEPITDDQMDELTTYISFVKNKMIPSDKWSQVKTEVPKAEQILREYEQFKKSGHRKRLIDYDDMLTIANEVLEGDKKLLCTYQQRYDYVITDESQDTSRVQHAIIEKLVREHANLCVVADDDQSIYSWRGAEPSYLLDFKQVYPQAVTLFMEQNYRSTPEIVQVANQFIKRNRQRYDKNMFTVNPPHEPIRIRNFAKYTHQTKYLVKEIQQLENLAEVAILYRNHSSSVSLMNEFDRAGVPFYMKDADNRFFSHWVVEDILNFMRMTFTDKRPDILEKIHLKFNGYISKQQMAAVKAIHNNESVFDNLLNHVPLQEYQIQPLTASKETFMQMRGMPPLHAIRVIRDRLGYEKAIEKMCERLGFRKEYLIGILNTLEEIADTLETMEEFANRLKHLEAVLKTAKSRKNHNAVTFSTLHSAKGLEFEKVYMIDLIDGIIPSADDVKGSSKDGSRRTPLMEEAARLFYVGMTRAKRHLELLLYRERDGEQTAESEFVTEIRNIMNPPKPISQVENERRGSEGQKGKRGSQVKSFHPIDPHAIRIKSELKVGQIVKHRVFGRAEVVQLHEDSLAIRVGEEIKKLSLQICLDKGLLSRKEQDEE